MQIDVAEDDSFRSALDRLNEYSDFVFTSSSAAIDAWIAAHPEPRPSRPEAIRRILAEALGKPVDAGSIAAEDLNASNDD